MELRRLGRTDLRVSAICLGTMTWGQQNDEAEAFRQMDAAVDYGINAFDAAEMYPVPPGPETQGRTEAYIGNWLASRKARDRVVLATKVTGRSEGFTWLRGGETRLDRANVEAALDASLRRLQTDYVDLYQLHWPDRRTNHFGRLGYHHDADDVPVPLEETLGVLDDLIRAGKIRHIGLSNETPWGAMECTRLARHEGLPRVAAIQNPYSLLNRTFESGLAEIAIREQVSLLAYSPLAGGTLTGKYLDGARPAGARMSLFGDRYPRYFTPTAEPAVREYVALARKHALEPAQMAIAWCLRQPFIGAVIIGATSIEQLQVDFGSDRLALAPEVVEGIEDIQRRIPNPCP